MLAGTQLVEVVRRPSPGRIRVAVDGLRGSPERESSVVKAFGAAAGVLNVQASALTGNALVIYETTATNESALLSQGARALTAILTEEASGLSVSPLPALSAKAGEAPRNRARPGGNGQQSYAQAAVTVEKAWHAMDSTQAAEGLEVNPVNGLDGPEVKSRRQKYGRNELVQPSSPSLLNLFGKQFKSFPVALLIGSAAVSVATGGVGNAVLIGIVLVVNAAAGSGTERSGNRAISSLRKTVAVKARVRRDNAEYTVDASELVPGDVIKLKNGDQIPADARLIQAERLETEESSLTGESLPATKDTEVIGPRTVLAERRCMVYRGTTVVSGYGEALVVSTGSNTIIGRLRITASRATPPPSPLQRDLTQMGRVLGFATLGISGIAFALTMLRGYGLLRAAVTSIALGVAAIPEGLTAISTTVLGLGARRMKEKGVLIRTVSAAETLGAITVVCADKTGTITENRMVVRECAVVAGKVTIEGAALSSHGEFKAEGKTVNPAEVPGVLRALTIAVVCNDAKLERNDGDVAVIDGSGTEAALLIAGLKAGLDRDALAETYPRLDQRDRSLEHRLMITVHSENGGRIAFVKGAPEDVFAVCQDMPGNGGTEAFDDAARSRFVAQNMEMADRGLRVLGLAERKLPEHYREKDLYSGFTFTGLIGIADPIRPGVQRAMDSLHRAGIRTIMITGDQAGTARAVARELKLSRRGSVAVMSGDDLSILSKDRLSTSVKDVGIFVRVQPEMKLSIVRALQDNGEIVAMTGDGVNDAPALRAADVGIAMGQRGTELARETSDVVLADDDFSQITSSVEEGRLLSSNVRRSLIYLLSTNATEVIMVIGAVAVGLPLPFTAQQLLWVNVVSDVGPAIGMATEPARGDTMSQPPRNPKEPILSRPTIGRMMLEAAVISAASFGVYGIGLRRYGMGPSASTMAFASLIGAQLMYTAFARNDTRPLGLRDLDFSRNLKIGVGASLLLAAGAAFLPPLRAILGGGPIGLVDALISLAGAVLPMGAIQLTRMAGSGQTRTAPFAKGTVLLLPAPQAP